MNAIRGPVVSCVVFSLLGVTSCASPGANDEPHSMLQALSMSCPTNRLVVRQPSAMRCADYKEFVAVEMLRTTSYRYCAYQLGGAGADGVVQTSVFDKSRVDALYGELEARVKNEVDGTPDALKLALDCPVLQGHAPLSTTPGEASIHRAFRASAGTLLDEGSAREVLRESKVKVSVLDSAAIPYNASCGPSGCGACRNPVPSDSNPHGRAMGRIISETACVGKSSESCRELVEIENSLVLPVSFAAPDQLVLDYNCGGHFGRLSDLTLALEKISAHGDDSEHARIINLSVAWAQKDEDVASEMVQTALKRASCSGALIIAAAGNAHADHNEGPLYPATWENLPAPSVSECRALGIVLDNDAAERVSSDALKIVKSRDLPIKSGLSPELLKKELRLDASKLPRAAQAPLLYAVSALDYADVPLGSVRQFGRSRIEALGMGGIATEPRLGNGQFTATFTGSSVSAAVLSGTAALVWKTRPTASAHEIMSEIYQTGRALSWSPDFGVGANDSRVSARAAALCEFAKANRMKCERVAGYPSFAGPAPSLSAEQAQSCDDPGVSCSPAGFALLDGPWLGPQPGEPSCPHCTYNTASGLLSIFYSNGYASLFKLYINNTAKAYSLPAAAAATPSVYYHNSWVASSASVPSRATLQIFDPATGTTRDEPVLMSH